jgi:ABC-type Fe3+-hydroxamate transport system substrate-binding protein
MYTAVADAVSELLIDTVPEVPAASVRFSTALALNPDLVIVTRARYLNEQPELSAAGADLVASVERVVASALARLLLRQLDIGEDQVDAEVARVNDEITTRTVYVGTRSIIREDVAAPLAGTMDEQMRAVGREFDETMFPLLTESFGNPLALDASRPLEEEPPVEAVEHGGQGESDAHRRG